ncbi:MAG: TonB-dependent receptor domain-containing protein [Flavisolibacter sp.]
MKWIIKTSLLLFCLPLAAQETDTLVENQLPSITIRAFEQTRKLKDIPAAINVVTKRTLDRFNPTAPVAAINTLPGIRMEERSPGSYRISIRGSSLRSPFGVRNVKVYYNDIPITDPGGHTYLNQLGFYNYRTIQIIKGPGSSFYGAGTGGVLLIEASNEDPSPIQAAFTAGSYGLLNSYAAYKTATESNQNEIALQHFTSNGYRSHSALQRTVATWNGLWTTKNGKLKTTFLWGDLHYQTPGGLTRQEFLNDPRASRPATPAAPSAMAAKASISQQQFISGASYEHQLSSAWKNKTVLYGMFTKLDNPNLQNYDRVAEPHFGGRTVFDFSKQLQTVTLSFYAGGEWQQGFSSVHIYRNNSGNPDSLRSADDISNRQAMLFAQAVMDMPGWNFSASVSDNSQRLKFERFSPGSRGKQQRDQEQLAPRFTVMKKFRHFNIYAGIAKGFSPPTTAELLPTGGDINGQLQAEKGINYDAGLKLFTPGGLYVDFNAFLFSLTNTIVQRRNAAGGDYFINAGKTRQWGFETLIQQPFHVTGRTSLFWLSHSFHHFRYREFLRQGNDYSGNKLPGTAPHTLSAGVDMDISEMFSASLTYTGSASIPLNDANSEFADPFHLLGFRMRYTVPFVKGKLDVSAGVENLLNETYSLGNDINGFGGRYFNAAPGRNYSLTLAFRLNRKGNAEH